MAKTTRKPGPKIETAPKYSLTIAVDPALARRFKAYCSYLGRDMGVVASELFTGGMVGFRVGYSAKGSSPENADDATAEKPAATADPAIRIAG